MTIPPMPMTPPPFTIRPLVARAVPYIGMFFMALVLWLPFGFKTTGLIEELTITEQFDAGHSLFFITPTSVMSISRSRPLQMFFFNASYVLDPNSYQFYQIFMMLFFFGKVVVTYWLVLQLLPGKQSLAFMAGVLFMLYPADTGLFPLRTLHIHSAVLAYLLAVYLLIQFYKQHDKKSWLALLGAGMLLIFSLGQYQIALAAAVITPLVLLYFGRPARRLLIAAAGWYGSMALILVYEIWAGKQPGTEAYEAVLLPAADLMSSPVKSMLSAVLVGYERQISGWLTAINKLNHVTHYWPYLLAGLIISAGVGWWLLRHKSSEREEQPISWKRYTLVLLTGIVLFPTGMATYLPLPNYRFEEFRIYLLAMFGSAVVLTLVLYLISRLVRHYREMVFLVLALPFIGLGLLSAFEQHQRYVNFSLEQQHILQQTVAQAPQLRPDTKIVIIDRAGMLNKAYVFYYGSLLQTGLRYLYANNTLEAYYCPVFIGTADNETCQFQADGLHIRDQANVLAYNRLLLFMTGDNGVLKLLTGDEASAAYGISGYDPQGRMTGATPPLRASTMFSCVPALSCIYETDDTQNIITGVIYDLPRNSDIGFGWREMEVNGNGETFHWTVSRTSTVDVNLPENNDLALEFNVLYWMDDALINSLTLSVNGQDIPLTFEAADPQGRLYRGVIPRTALTGRPTKTQLVFSVDHIVPVINDPNMRLGFALNALQIRPT